jgi:large subunit ribosomal protein L44e
MFVYMKLPAELKTYCPKCNAHTVHEIEKTKKHKASELKWGQRRFRRALSGYGSFPRAKPHREKTTKRLHLLYRCTSCKKSTLRPGIRSGRFELK